MPEACPSNQAVAEFNIIVSSAFGGCHGSFSQASASFSFALFLLVALSRAKFGARIGSQHPPILTF
jgi:hypothetical protein